jgi:hypothetical protein
VACCKSVEAEYFTKVVLVVVVEEVSARSLEVTVAGGLSMLSSNPAALAAVGGAIVASIST